MKLAFFSTKSYDKEFFDHYNHKEIQLKYFEVRLYKDTANLAKNYDGVCVFVHDDLDEETLEILAENGVKFVVLRCAGFNNVNLAAAAKFGIKVYRVPAYSPEAVAEHAVALILTLNRKTHKAYNRIREGNFSLERLRGFNLHGKTVGVIGTGKIGSIFAKNMTGFGCKIIAYDKFENQEILNNGGTYVSFEELMRQSDIISLHCPLNPETKHIINEESFKLMKDGMMLINTSRGPLINTLDTIEALKSGKLGYLGIDVYEQEEQLFFKDLSESIIKDDVISRLISFPNVLITAHQGFLTKEALQQIAEVTIQNIKDFEEGRDTNNQLKV
ncbi:2-hydroxyacid dehydrogenase [Zunongwangia sp. HGR-M22]|uniref:2-hydroxyacid dehydrogenase n=1 Tax=Zunongwangia sp. HGR-M22 TaxID=3015168 RepID=UPI0022DDBCCD|nr:2-hydroxyacid dehydrogenase [Zunongwangia sp. HGR-M22]WBL25687.1 2-hydroxyacid dehydrogenase [Zunongwangia sp. HGR-M22]